ncbi:unnamed protein product, partial [Scytosiphon promiscuus]
GQVDGRQAPRRSVPLQPQLQRQQQQQQQQQKEEEHSYSSGSVERRFVGARTGGDVLDRPWSAAAAAAAVSAGAAGDARSPRWGNYDEKEPTGIVTARNGQPYAFRSPREEEETEEEEQDVGFGYRFGRRDTPGVGRASPYPLGRHDEEDEEDEEE